MAYSKEFDEYLKKDTSYNDYLDSPWCTLNTIRGCGTVTFNKLAFGACCLGAAYSAANLTAIAIRPNFKLISWVSVPYAAIGGVAIGLGYKLWKRMHQPAEVEEAPKVKVK